MFSINGRSGVAYSNNGRTYVTKALSCVLRCLAWKHLKIKLALVRALLTTVQIRCDIVNLFSIKMPTSRITETGLMLNFIRLINTGLTKVQYCRFLLDLPLIGPSYNGIEATL